MDTLLTFFGDMFSSDIFWYIVTGLLTVGGVFWRIYARKNNLPSEPISDVIDEGIEIARKRAEECAAAEAEKEKNQKLQSATPEQTSEVTK